MWTQPNVTGQQLQLPIAASVVIACCQLLHFYKFWQARRQRRSPTPPPPYCLHSISPTHYYSTETHVGRQSVRCSDGLELRLFFFLEVCYQSSHYALKRRNISGILWHVHRICVGYFCISDYYLSLSTIFILFAVDNKSTGLVWFWRIQTGYQERRRYKKNWR